MHGSGFLVGTFLYFTLTNEEMKNYNSHLFFFKVGEYKFSEFACFVFVFYLGSGFGEENFGKILTDDECYYPISCPSILGSGELKSWYCADTLKEAKLVT